MRKIRHLHVVKPAAGGVVDGLVKSMRAHADGRPAEVELADVDRVQRGVKSLVAPDQDFFIGNPVILQFELGHVGLAVDDVPDQLEAFRLGIRHEEQVFAAIRHPAEGGNHARLVGVADVVLATRNTVIAITLGRDHHVGGVNIGAVLFFRQAESKYFTLF